MTWSDDQIIAAIKNLLDSKILKLDDLELDDIGLDDICQWQFHFYLTDFEQNSWLVRF